MKTFHKVYTGVEFCRSRIAGLSVLCVFSSVNVTKAFPHIAWWRHQSTFPLEYKVWQWSHISTNSGEYQAFYYKIIYNCWFHYIFLIVNENKYFTHMIAIWVSSYIFPHIFLLIYFSYFAYLFYWGAFFVSICRIPSSLLSILYTIYTVICLLILFKVSFINRSYLYLIFMNDFWWCDR